MISNLKNSSKLVTAMVAVGIVFGLVPIFRNSLFSSLVTFRDLKPC